MIHDSKSDSRVDSRFEIRGGVPMEKRVILVTGSRTITSYKIIALILDRFHIAKLLFGDAAGVDEITENYAKTHGIPFDRCDANWNRYGEAAGVIRNGEMVQKIQKANGLVVAIWDGTSPGTHDCMKQAIKKGVVVYQFIANLQQILSQKTYNANWRRMDLFLHT